MQGLTAAISCMLGQISSFEATAYCLNLIVKAGTQFCRSGTNNSALFAEIVPEQLRSAVYAFDRSFEGAVGATAAPLVGLVAERVFGYHGSLGGTAVPDQAALLANARALGNSMLILLLIPWGLDFFFYCGKSLMTELHHGSLSYSNQACNLQMLQTGYTSAE